MSTEVEVTSSSKYPTFDGTDEKFRFYKVKMKAHLSKYGYMELMMDGTKVEKDNWKPVTGSNATPAEEVEAVKDLQKKNSKAAGILLDSIDVKTKEGEVAFDLLASHQNNDYASGKFKDMWESLLDLYDAEDTGEVAARRTEYYAKKMDIEDNPKKFEIMLRVKRDELSKDGFKIQTDDYIKDLLEKLPRKKGELGVYHEVKKATLKALKTQNHGITVKKVVDDLCEIYDEIKNRDEDGKAKSSQETAFMMNGKQFKGRCRNCGKIGHKASGCPDKKSGGKTNGYRNQSKGRSGYDRSSKSSRGQESQAKKKFNGSCFHCGIKGHRKSECRKLQRESGQEGANTAQMDRDEVVFHVMDTSDIDWCRPCGKEQETGGDEESSYMSSDEWNTFWDEFSCEYSSDEDREVMTEDTLKAFEALKSIGSTEAEPEWIKNDEKSVTKSDEVDQEMESEGSGQGHETCYLTESVAIENEVKTISSETVSIHLHDTSKSKWKRGSKEPINFEDDNYYSCLSEEEEDDASKPTTQSRSTACRKHNGGKCTILGSSVGRLLGGPRCEQQGASDVQARLT